MKKPNSAHKAKKVSDNSAVIKKLLLAVVGAVLMTAVVLYNLWSWVVDPANEQRFAQSVMSATEEHRRSVQTYLTRLEQPLHKMIQEIPAYIIGSYASKEWLATYQQQNISPRVGLKTLTLFSVDDIELYPKMSPNLIEANNIRFVVTDMVNRLQNNKPIYIEAARAEDGNKWELHSLIALNDHSNNLQGVLHSTFAIDGVRSVFTDVDLALGKINFIQAIENEQSLQFLSVGNGASKFSPKTKTIENSHWRISYQPSLMAYEQAQHIPFWFFITAVLMPLAIIAIAAYSLYRENPAGMPRLQERPLSTQGPAEKAIDGNKAKVPVVNGKTIEPEKPTEETESEEDKLIIPDSIFRAYDIRGLAHAQLSDDLMFAIGQAVATEVLEAGETAMVVGYDARSHSQEFSIYATEGIISTGCDVINIGLVSTPLMNFTAHKHSLTSSGLIVTASHNPKEYNGCKMVVKGQTLVDDDIQRLKARIIKGKVTLSKTKGQITQENHSQSYIDTVIDDVVVMGGWRIVIDAANGATSELAPRLFNALDCQVTPLFCQFDGEFPNHDPDPSQVKNLSSLIDTVKDNNADIGFAFDGDGDRLMVITQSGKIIWPDQLLMLFAEDVVTRNPGCDVVYDIKSTHLLADMISKNGGRPIMWKTGHSHIKAKMRETGALLGGEFSGHIFFKERWFGFDDGLYAAARLLELMTFSGQSIDELFAKLSQTVSTPEIKVAISEEKKFGFIEDLKENSHFSRAQITVLDGLRVDFDEGWGLVRASNTSPALTLRFEASEEAALNNIQEQFKQLLHKTDSSLELTF